MLFLEVVLFLAAATGVGFLLARFVLVRPADDHVIPRALTELRIERDSCAWSSRRRAGSSRTRAASRRRRTRRTSASST